MAGEPVIDDFVCRLRKLKIVVNGELLYFKKERKMFIAHLNKQ